MICLPTPLSESRYREASLRGLAGWGAHGSAEINQYNQGDRTAPLSAGWLFPRSREMSPALINAKLPLARAYARYVAYDADHVATPAPLLPKTALNSISLTSEAEAVLTGRVAARAEVA
jgi:hypothetical protein